MNALIVTVAGLSSRFSKSIGKETLKCIFNKGNVESTLLVSLVRRFPSFDYYVFVGGYKYDELHDFVTKNMDGIMDKVILVNNSDYMSKGSGFSLFLGLKALEDKDIDSIIFAEGDLFIDRESLHAVYQAESDVITVNGDQIDSEKSVVAYTDASDQLHYLYDLNHSLLEIREPFKKIYNSGQVWKFIHVDRLFSITDGLTEIEKSGTNLVIIQKYFGVLQKGEYKVIKCNEWINCNTIQDYEKAGM